MKRAKIYIPTKTALQSGKGKIKNWILKFKTKDTAVLYYSSGTTNDPKIIELRTKLAECHPIARKIKFFAGKKSFTVNKKDMTLCLKDENDKYKVINIVKIY